LGHKKGTHFFDIPWNPKHPLPENLCGRSKAERSKGSHKTGAKGKKRKG
jgi:hypothetical protein